MQKRNKTKQNLSKKHKYYADLILNHYVIKNVEAVKYKEIFDPYFTHHSRKFDFFTVNIFSRFSADHEPCNEKISIPSIIYYRIESNYYSTCIRESASDFL